MLAGPPVRDLWDSHGFSIGVYNARAPMPLTSGTRLGPYEIVAAIGAGGMGEVYRARDTKLNRDVALKVLPSSVANDPERLARFRREAQVLAALNHPNIAHIHGLEDASSAPALVMELVGGPTLAELLLAKGPGQGPRTRQAAWPCRRAGHRAPDRERARGGARAEHHSS